MEASNSETKSTLLALSRQMAEAVERVSTSIVGVDARQRVRTSGVIWRPGVVVSTNHTVRRNEEITVTLHNGQEANATLAGRDNGTDLAVLTIEDDKNAGEANSPARFARDSLLKVGNLVLAVGRAHPERGVSASFGIISGSGDKWRTWRGAEIDRFIKPDLSIFVGFSGGALIDTEGHVLGINTSGLARGAGLTLPVSTVDRVVDQLLARGRVARPYLGVGMHSIPLPEKLREKLNLRQTNGLIMLSVEANAPAEKAGITIGDILLALGDESITDTDDVQAVLASKEVGGIIKAKILRGEDVKELQITLGERSARNS